MNEETPNDIVRLDDQAQNDLALKKANEIFCRIESVANRIKESKEESGKVKDMSSGWFGKTSRKADATAKALVSTNEAMADMNNLIMESVRFTCRSVDFSRVMLKAMSKMIATGFQDRDGALIKLSENGTEIAEIIMSQAEDFTKKQAEVEKAQERLAAQICDVEKQSSQKDSELEMALSVLALETKRQDAELKLAIEEKTREILLQSDENDEKQNREIMVLELKAKEIANISESNDQKHDKEIQDLHEATIVLSKKREANDERHDSQISELLVITSELRKQVECLTSNASSTPIKLSIVALIGSIISFALAIVGLFF